MAQPMVTADSARQYEGRDLEAMAFAENYHAWIVDEFAPYLGREVAEIGAGAGALSRLVLGSGSVRLTAIEPADAMFERLQASLRGRECASVRHGLLRDFAAELHGRFDSMVYVNVLEHVEDDGAELALVHSCLRPGGHVCVFVPALPALYSRFDAEIGHYRRYRRGDLGALLRASGFDVVELRYLDLPGIAPWFVLMRLLRRRLDRRSVALYDRWAVPVVRAVETRVRVPIGKNLLAVARRS